MTVDELDTTLAKWQRDITAATSNLVSFEDNDSYKVAKTVLPHLEGKTKDTIGLPISALEQVWDLLGKLNTVIKEANNLRQNLPLVFGRQGRIKQIEDLLIGPSICLQVKEIPLEERGLTGSSHLNKMTCPSDVFGVIQAKYLDAAKAAAQYEKVCEDLAQKISEAETDLNAKFGMESDTRIEEAKVLLHTDPIAGLDLLKKAKREATTKRREATIKTLSEVYPSPVALPSLGGSLHTFLAEPATKKKLLPEPSAVIIAVSQPVKETCKLTEFINAPATLALSNLAVKKVAESAKSVSPVAPQTPTVNSDSLENLFGRTAQAPKDSSPGGANAGSLENLIHGGAETSPASSTQLEDLFS